MTFRIKIFMRQVTCHILDENLSERVRNIIKIILDCFVKVKQAMFVQLPENSQNMPPLIKML